MSQQGSFQMNKRRYDEKSSQIQLVIFLHPDYTVGFGISPNLLTLSIRIH
jgi:hypothetical protein